jgi:hypothetical protein
MQSIGAANAPEAVPKNEIWPWPIDFICSPTKTQQDYSIRSLRLFIPSVVASGTEWTHLVFVKFGFLTFPFRNDDDARACLCAIA